MSWIHIVAITLLLLITYQDFKYRAISWYLLPVSLIFIVIANIGSFPKGSYWINIGYNLLFLLSQLLLLTAYFALKRIGLRRFFQSFMGLGDILFFLVLALVLPFPVFPLFFVISLTVSLVTGIFFFRENTIPLAGIQAFLLAVFLGFNGSSLMSTYSLNTVF